MDAPTIIENSFIAVVLTRHLQSEFGAYCIANRAAVLHGKSKYLRTPLLKAPPSIAP